MSLKQSNKIRVELDDTQLGDFDYDGTRMVLFNNKLFSGYVVYDRHVNGNIENEIEYKNGSHLGWENEYNENGQLVYSCLTVGQTPLEIYKYDDNGILLDHWKTVGDDYYQEMVYRYKLD
jgi:antitoxin component YwqK of YwqJK toxin-antitoxin module